MMLSMLGKCGAEIGKDKDHLDKEGKPCRWFSLRDDTKRTWFKGRFDKLRKRLRQMDLDGFCSDYKVTELSTLIDDDYGDMMYIDGDGWMTFDSGVRSIQPGTRYYVTNAILLH